MASHQVVGIDVHEPEMNFYKVGMLFMNLTCVILSAAIILAGYAVKMKLDRVEPIIPGVPLILPSTVLYTVGLAMFILVVTVGCVGVMKENGTLLFMYSFFMLFLIIVQIGLACFAILQVDNVNSGVTRNFREHFRRVMLNDPDSAAYFGEVQSILQCCGYSGAVDYTRSMEFPNSCCEETEMPCTSDKAFAKGCIVAITDYLHSITELFSGICIVAAILQFFVVIYVGFFADKVKMGLHYFD